ILLQESNRSHCGTAVYGDDWIVREHALHGPDAMSCQPVRQRRKCLALRLRGSVPAALNVPARSVAWLGDFGELRIHGVARRLGTQFWAVGPSEVVTERAAYLECQPDLRFGALLDTRRAVV